MPELTRLSLRLLRRHLGRYAGAMVTLSVTVVIATGQAALVAALSRPEQVVVPGLAPAEVAAQLFALRGLLSMLSGLAIGIGGFLLWSAVKQVVSFRHRELGLMRLMGAGRGQLARVVFLECAGLGWVVALPSALVGSGLARPLFAGLQAIGFFGQGMQVDIGFSLGAALLVTLIAASTAGLAGMLAALSATRGDLASAVNPLVLRLPRGQVVWRVVVGVAGLAGLVLLDTRSLGPSLVLALPVLAVVPLLALAPLLIPAGARLVGRVVGLAAPGAGVLAAQRASRDRVRYARMAAPVIVAVGVLGGFLVANAPDEQLRAELYRSRLAASAVVAVTGVPDADRAVAALRPQAELVARLASTTRTVSGEPQLLYFADAAPLARLQTQTVLAGDPLAVTGLEVASSVDGARIGDALTVLDGRGRPVTLRVVAVLGDPLLEGVFLDWAQTRRFVPDVATLPVQLFTDPVAPAAAQAALEAAGVPATVVDREGYLQQLEDARRANTYRSNLGIFGTIYLMSALSLIQAAVSGALARRREFGVLRTLGVGRPGVLLTVATEMMIVQLVAGVLVATVLVALGLQFASVNGTSAVAAIASVSPVTAVAYGSVAAVAISAQLLGACLVLFRRPADGAAGGRPCRRCRGWRGRRGPESSRSS